MKKLILKLSNDFEFLSIDYIEKTINNAITYFKLNNTNSTYEDTLHIKTNIIFLPDNVNTILSIDTKYKFHFNYKNKLLIIYGKIHEHIVIKCLIEKTDNEIIELSDFYDYCYKQLKEEEENKLNLFNLFFPEN